MKFSDAMKIFGYLKNHQSDPQFEASLGATDDEEPSDKIAENYLILIKHLILNTLKKSSFPITKTRG